MRGEGQMMLAGPVGGNRLGSTMNAGAVGGLPMNSGPAGSLVQYQMGGNFGSQGVPLSVFGTGWGCCPPLFDKCTDDEVMMLFHGLDAVEPGLRWLGLRKAMHMKEKRAYLSYVAPAGAAAGEPVDGLPLTVCGPGVCLSNEK